MVLAEIWVATLLAGFVAAASVEGEGIPIDKHELWESFEKLRGDLELKPAV